MRSRWVAMERPSQAGAGGGAGGVTFGTARQKAPLWNGFTLRKKRKYLLAILRLKASSHNLETKPKPCKLLRN
jgi:hypothetical protein